MDLVILLSRLARQKGPSVNKHPVRVVEITPCHMFHSALAGPAWIRLHAADCLTVTGNSRFGQNVSNNCRQGERTAQPFPPSRRVCTVAIARRSKRASGQRSLTTGALRPAHKRGLKPPPGPPAGSRRHGTDSFSSKKVEEIACFFFSF